MIGQLDLIENFIPEAIKVWLAAAIEYEGNISIIKDHKRHQYYAVVRISNTKRELADCEELKLFGGGLTLESRSNGKGKPIWRRDYRSRQLVRLLNAVRPYLKTKGEQADIALKLAERQLLTSIQIPEYEAMHQRVKELNRRTTEIL